MSGAGQHAKDMIACNQRSIFPVIQDFVAAGDMDVFAAMRTERRNSWRNDTKYLTRSTLGSWECH